MKVISAPAEAPKPGADQVIPPKPNKPTAPTSTQDYYLSEATASDKVVAVSDEFTAKANQLHIELGPPGSDGTERGQEILLLQAEDNFWSELSDADLSRGCLPQAPGEETRGQHGE